MSTNKTYETWAGGTAANIAQPTSTLISEGWTGVQPAYEHFNWLFNRIDTRLSDLELPASRVTLLSAAGSRAAEIPANGLFEVPPYKKGSDQLQVYLDGILCLCRHAGDDAGPHMYMECDPEAGNTKSTKIKFLDRIPTNIEIYVTCKETASCGLTTDLMNGINDIIIDGADLVARIDPADPKTPFVTTTQRTDVTISADEQPASYVKRVTLVIRLKDVEAGGTRERRIVHLDGIVVAFDCTNTTQTTRTTTETTSQTASTTTTTTTTVTRPYLTLLDGDTALCELIFVGGRVYVNVFCVVSAGAVSVE